MGEPMKEHYVRPIPKTWFMRTTAYKLFMVRELTSVFLTIYLLFFLYLLERLGAGAEAFASLLEKMKSPVFLIFHLVALVAAIWHSVTWFNSTAKAMKIRTGETRVPDAAVSIGAGYLPWIVVSAFVTWFILR